MVIYLGRSPVHAGKLALVLNPNTGLVSPQYHVVFDDDFTTALHLRKGTFPPNWDKLVLSSRERSTDELFDLTQIWMQPTSDDSVDEILETLSNVNEGDEAIRNVTKDSEGDTSYPRVRFSKGDHLSPNAQVSKGDSDDNDLVIPTMMNLESSGLRHSSRIASVPKKRYNFFSGISKFCVFGVLLLSTITKLSVDFSHVKESVNAAIHNCNVINANFDGLLNEIHHMVLAAGKSKNENYTFCEMLKQDDASEFIKAMGK